VPNQGSRYPHLIYRGVQNQAEIFGTAVAVIILRLEISTNGILFVDALKNVPKNEILCYGYFFPSCPAHLGQVFNFLILTLGGRSACFFTLKKVGKNSLTLSSFVARKAEVNVYWHCHSQAHVIDRYHTHKRRLFHIICLGCVRIFAQIHRSGRKGH